MKQVIVSLALLLFLPLGLQAQEGDSWQQRAARGDRNPGQQIERMARFLELNDEQKTELTEYFTANTEAMRGEMAEAESQEDRRAIAEDYRALRDEKIRSVLDEEQLRKYDQMLQARERRAEQGRNRRPAEERSPGERAAQLAQRLDLSEDQTAELKAYMESNGASMREELEAAADQSARREIMKSYAEATDEKIRSVLTPEQLEEYEQLQARRGERRTERRSERRGRESGGR